MKTGVQGLGWYVLRAKDPVPLIRFYRDILGLGELRGREVPAEQASAMLWAGGTTVFEPNRGGRGEPHASVNACPFVPVFRSRAIDRTLGRLFQNAEISTDDALTLQGDTHYFRDPLGFIFGVEPADETSPQRLDPENNQPLSLPEMDHPLEGDILDLGRLEYRSSTPDDLRSFYRSVFNFETGVEGDLDLDMGDGSALRFLEGGAEAPEPVADREDETAVPVFRLYGYEDFITRVKESGAKDLQEVDLPGGRLWYGWDPAGRLFGFQERRPPHEDPKKWTTRLPEDMMARRIWTTG